MRVQTRAKRHDQAVFRSLRHQLAQAVRHQFQQDHKRAGFLQRFGIIQDFFGSRGALALQPEAAQRADALRGEAQVANGRDARVHNRAEAFAHS